MGCYALQIIQHPLYFLASDESDVFDLPDCFIVVYLNDILVFSELLRDHLAYLCIVL